MVREQITHQYLTERVLTEKEIDYLSKLRQRAIDLLKLLSQGGLPNCFVHGSIARGDITLKSDIDLFVEALSSFKLEFILENASEIIEERILTQATPNHSPKAIIKLQDLFQIHLSFPLIPLRTREMDFYKFGGLVNINDLKNNRFVNGVNKRLQFVRHISDHKFSFSRILDDEHSIAHQLGISIDTVIERVRVLTRRNKIGRTGIFLSRILNPDEQFEAVLQEIADQNPAVRRYLRSHGKKRFR